MATWRNGSRAGFKNQSQRWGTGSIPVVATLNKGKQMSDSSSSSSSSAGIGFLGLLTIVLVILKAMGYLNVSWLVCFLPIIIGWGIILLILLVALVIALLK